MNSQNHVMMLGDLLVWYYESLAGIKSDTENAGFKKVVMKPEFINGLNAVNASYQSIYGLIKSNWKKEGRTLKWNITVPANSKAIIYLPNVLGGSIQESGKSVNSAKGVKFLKMEGHKLVYEIGSGNYSFSSDI